MRSTARSGTNVVVNQFARTRSVLGRVFITLAGVSLVVGGLIAIGNSLRESLGPQERYTLPFSDVECPAPPGQERAKFLIDVQYLGEMPDKLSVLDPLLRDKLTAAFVRHPRVERVDEIHIDAPKHIRVSLTFRPE